MATSSVRVSYTEFPHFMRLVEFLTDCHDLAFEADEADIPRTDLRELVDCCRADLLNYHGR